MCIIAYSPKSNPIPSAERRAQMFKRNPDGAGFMFPVDGHVHIEKGFMTLADMEARLEELSYQYDFTELPVVFHYRIGTHGGNTPQNTHPFPITTDRKALKELTVDAPIGVAHNGIIHCVKPRKGYSDTQEYIVRRLANLPRFTKEVFKQILDETCSKFALMWGDGTVRLIGAIERDEDDGCYYSNTSYIGYQDMYTQRASTWDRTYRSLFSSGAVLSCYTEKVIPLDNDIVIDVNGCLHDGAEYCMDVYGRIYAYNEDGTATPARGAHLLVGGARHRNGALDMSELEEDLASELNADYPWD